MFWATEPNWSYFFAIGSFEALILWVEEITFFPFDLHLAIIADAL
jgi:hypothetical protein